MEFQDMSQEIRQTELQEQTRQLLQGPLKHIRAAALAAALLPLASVAAAPASAQSCTVTASAGVCGTVFTDTNDSGILVPGTGIPGIAVNVCQLCNGTDNIVVYTDLNGSYSVPLQNMGPATISVLIPTGTLASPVVPGGNAGSPNGFGYSVATVPSDWLTTDFGFFTSPVQQPGTGTPGYWKNHPDAWPVTSITVGGVTYTKAQAIMWLGKVGKDKTTTMFSSLVPAMLNVLIGNDGSCVNAAIAAGNAWMAAYGPVGSNVAGSSSAWSIGEPTHITLDGYNNGLLCAPHRQ
jgi:hypothetical protein